MKILTFDIEEWFHLLDHPSTRDENQWNLFPSRIEANLDRILEILSISGSSATFFCLGWIAEKYPHLIKNIAAAGFEIGSHSHLHQIAYEQSPNEFKKDLRRSIAVISNLTGAPVEIYRIPGFSLIDKNLWVFDLLAEEGIKIDCSVFPAKRSHGGLPIFSEAKPCIVNTGIHQILEFPINIQHLAFLKFVFSGGGYFRLLPYPLIHYLFGTNEYVMTYFHPRDFDPSQPIIQDLSLNRRFKSYIGLNGAEKKLTRILKDFDFVDVRQAAKLASE
jgi:polysaccharide deacetylase family protein (PEP-CTERM system associated)